MHYTCYGSAQNNVSSRRQQRRAHPAGYPRERGIQEADRLDRRRGQGVRQGGGAAHRGEKRRSLRRGDRAHAQGDSQERRHLSAV